MALQQEVSPLTGIIAEDLVVIDFGEHEGKSVLEIADTEPDFYEYLINQREEGNFSIRRTKDKIFTPETSFLRLGNFKSKKFLNWHPKWSLEKSLNKILDWYYLTEFQNARNICENQIKEFIKKNNGRRKT